MESETQSRGRGTRRPNSRGGPSTYAGRNGHIMPFRGRGRPFRSRASGGRVRGRGYPGRFARPPYHHSSSHGRRSPYGDHRDSSERRHYDSRRRSRSRSWSRLSRSRSRSRSRRRSTSPRRRSRSRSRSRGRSSTQSRSRSRHRSPCQLPVAVPDQTSRSAVPLKPVSVLDRLGPQHLLMEKTNTPAVPSIRITVGNDHYVQQAAKNEKAGEQAPTVGLSGGAIVDGRGGHVKEKSSYSDRNQRWSSDQERDHARYYESRPSEHHPKYDSRPWEQRSRSPERCPRRDYGTPRERYSQEHRSSADRDRRDYHSQQPDRSYYRHSPNRKADRRDYRRSLSRSPDRREYRRSPSPDARDYRRSPGRRSISQSPSTSRSSYSTNDTRQDYSRESAVRDKVHHADNPIFRDTPEFRVTDGIPATPSVRSILKNKADVSTIESPSPFRSESSFHGDLLTNTKTMQSHFGLPGIGCLDEIEDEDEFLYGGGDSIKSAAQETAVGISQCETFDYGHKPQRIDNKGFPSSLVPDYDEDAAGNDELPPSQPPNPAIGASAIKSSATTPSTEAADKKEPYDPTIENILKAIGFNFELSKLMQEKAKKEREKQEKKDSIGAYSINQTSSFLSSGLKNIDLGSVFDQKPGEKEQASPVEKKTELSYAELGRKYREEQMRAYQQGRSPPPPFHEKPQVERQRRKSDSMSPPRRERSRRRSESFSPPPLHRCRRSPSNEHGSPRSTKRSRSNKDTDPSQRSLPHQRSPPCKISPPHPPHMLQPPAQTDPATLPTSATIPQQFSVPLPYYGAPGWDPNMPYGPYGGAYAGQPGYYPPPGQYPMDWPHFPANYPPPAIHPDLQVGDNQYYPKTPISSNLKVIPVIDDIAEQKSSRKDSDSSVTSPCPKPSSRTVLPLRSESDRRVEVGRCDDKKVEPRRRDDTKMSRGDPKKSQSIEDRRHSEDSKTVTKRDGRSTSWPTLSEEARERLLAEMQQRRKRLKTLEKELDTLRRQQNELMRKKQRQRDGHKDPLLTENSKLQEEIAQQISMLRRAADQNSSTLKAAGISDIEIDDSPRVSENKSSQRRLDKSVSVKTEKAADKPKDESKTINYEYFDPGNHWCRVCNHISTNIFDVFSHLHSKRHQQNVDHYDRPWVPASLDLKGRSKKPTKSQIVVAPIKGVEFLMASQAFYCSICSTFSGDGACAEDHLKSREHNDAYNAYCNDNPFYERHFELDRAAGLSVMKFEGNHDRESGRLEDTHGIASKSLTKDQMTAELVRRRVEAVNRKIRLDNSSEDGKNHFHDDSQFLGDMSSAPPPTHYPRPKDKFLAKEAAMAGKEQREKPSISIKLSGKQRKFPSKNPLSSAAVKKSEPSLFRPVIKRPDRQASRHVAKPQAEPIFPLRKVDERKVDETDDYMSSVDIFVSSSEGPRKKKKPTPAAKGTSKVLSQSDIMKAFSGHDEREKSGNKPDTALVSPVMAPPSLSVAAHGSTQPVKADRKQSQVEPDSRAATVSDTQGVSTQAVPPAVGDRIVLSQQHNEDAKSEGSGISMGSDFEILDELNAG